MLRTVITVCIIGIGVLLEVNATPSEKYATSFSSFVSEVNKQLKNSNNNQPRNFVYDENESPNKYVQHNDKPNNDDVYFPYEGDMPAISDDDMKYFMKHGKLPNGKGEASGIVPKNKYKSQSPKDINYQNDKDVYNLGGGFFGDSSSTVKPKHKKYESSNKNQQKDLFASLQDNKKYVQEMFDGLIQHNDEYLKAHKGLIDLPSKLKSKYETPWSPTSPASLPTVTFKQDHLDKETKKVPTNIGYGDESLNAYKALYEIPAKQKNKNENSWNSGKTFSSTPIPYKAPQRHNSHYSKNKKPLITKPSTSEGQIFGKATKGVPFVTHNKITFTQDDAVTPVKGLYTNIKPKPGFDDLKQETLFRYSSTQKPPKPAPEKSYASTPKTKYNYENYYANRPTPKQKPTYDNSYTPRSSPKTRSTTQKSKFVYETSSYKTSSLKPKYEYDFQEISSSKPKFNYENSYQEVSSSKPKFNYESSFLDISSSPKPKFNYENSYQESSSPKHKFNYESSIFESTSSKPKFSNYENSFPEISSIKPRYNYESSLNNAKPKFDYEKSKHHQSSNKAKFGSENPFSDAFKVGDDIVDKRPLLTAQQELGEWKTLSSDVKHDTKQQQKKKKCQQTDYAVSEANPSEGIESVTFPHYSKNYKITQPKQSKEEKTKQEEKHIFYYGKNSKNQHEHGSFPKKYSEASIPYHDFKDDNNDRFPNEFTNYALFEEK